MDNPVRYAIIFKTHFWDGFVERQFRRLCAHAGPGRVFVVVDETWGAVPGIDHDDVLRMTEAMSEAEGYLRYPTKNLFWYNTDYQLYHFIDAYTEYDFLFICEYDCLVSLDVDNVIQTMARDGLGFVGERIRIPPQFWDWTRFARPYYPEELEFSGRLVCCAAFSRDFVRQLQAARRDHSRRVLSGKVPGAAADSIIWPNNEAFIGAEIARLKVVEAPLSAFGNTSCYDWAPPHPEFALSALSERAVVHPVLDSRRYLQAITKVNWKVDDLFKEGSQLQRDMEACDPACVVPMFLQKFAETRDFGAIERLHDYANRRSGGAARGLFNVARGKPATQSSISKWSRAPTPAQDAAGAVNGSVTGYYGFHTNLDEEPWWCVDLEAVFPVLEIRIYNRMDHPSRARSLIVSFSSDLVQWHMLFRHEGGQNFGGADGNPLRIELLNPVEMRFLRIHLPRKELLHLDEVEVYV